MVGDHDFRVREGKSFALFACREEDGAHRSRHADADGRDVRLNVIHGIDDRQPCCDVAAGTIDIKGNIFLRVFGGKEEHLRDDKVCNLIVNRAAEEDNALLEEARVNIICPLAHRALLDNHRN